MKNSRKIVSLCVNWNKELNWIDRNMYERVWDEADYVVPPAENGAFFVTTNVVITPNQTWGRCPEVAAWKHTKKWTLGFQPEIPEI